MDTARVSRYRRVPARRGRVRARDAGPRLVRIMGLCEALTLILEVARASAVVARPVRAVDRELRRDLPMISRRVPIWIVRVLRSLHRLVLL